MMNNSGDNILNNDDFSSCKQDLKLELEVLNIEEPKVKAPLLLELGLTELFRKNYDKAIKHIEEAQKLFLEIQDINKIAMCLAELGIIHYKKNNDRLIRSLTLLNDAKYLIANKESKNDVESKIFHYYGIINYSEKRYSEALRYYKNAQKLVSPDHLESACILDSLAIFYMRVNNNQIALQCLNESLKIKKIINNTREIAITEILFGRYLSGIENYEDAVKYLKEALLISETHCDYFTVARLLDEMAKIYVNLEDYSFAEKLCAKSLKIAKAIDSELIYAFSSCTYADIKIQQGETSEISSLIENEIEPIFISNSSVRGLALVKRVKANLAEKLEEYTEAIEYIHESAGLFSEIGVNSEVAKCYFSLGNIYKKNIDIPMASSSLLEALRIAKICELSILTKKIEDNLFEIDQNQWVNVINKIAKKEDIFIE